MNYIDVLILQKLNHVTIAYGQWIESVKMMIQEHYDTPEYDNTVILVNTLPGNEYRDLLNTYDKRIYYMLEHIVSECDYTQHFYEWDTYFIDLCGFFNINEMWTMDYNPQFARRCREKYDMNIIYRPVRYTSLINLVDNIYTTPKIVDTCLIGSIGSADHRLDVIKDVERDHLFSIKILTQTKNLQSTIPELNTAKYILDMPRDNMMLSQNQVRIFELLCMGYTVICEKKNINIFPGLIYEFETVGDICGIIKKGGYLHPTDAYKEMTYTDEAYKKYVSYLIELQAR